MVALLSLPCVCLIVTVPIAHKLRSVYTVAWNLLKINWLRHHQNCGNTVFMTRVGLSEMKNTPGKSSMNIGFI